MFSDSETFNPVFSASVPVSAPAIASVSALPATTPISPSAADAAAAESILSHILFAMPAPLNTITHDFSLFDSVEDPVAWSLFGEADLSKTAKLQPAPAALFANPLVTPQTPSLDLTDSSPAKATGFDSCALFLEDQFQSQGMLHSFLDTPCTPAIDTPMLAADSALDVSFLDGLVAKPLPLFTDLDLGFALGFQDFTIEPTQLATAQDFFPSPAVSDLTSLSAPASPFESPIFMDDIEGEFVSSRSQALVSGLKRSADDSVSADLTKKARVVSVDSDASKPSPSKRFSCQYPGCDRRFARLFNLHTHEKTHDPEQARPFICPESSCSKAFSRKHDLQRHEASVHKGERNFSCSTCNKPFSRQDGLRRHLAVKGSCADNGWQAT
ncbi:hypothetical protein BGW38_007364 [Lunasporangiospora selenospora]|uniref:C2H2-type domain-containing protein n=1 Tax=Lunasporangiospora selenospora TaxID=979761 RepID=A0A9P6FZ93_9FUNG|nr:hypothetical protein BGW38_007364 [Lunasporangiospora selenospora]